MTNKTRTLIGLILLVLGSGRCSDLSSPAAPYGRICASGCAFEIRFGAKDGQRRAYLTVDYGHDNPGTIADVAVVQGQLVVTPTSTYPPGSPTLSGVVAENTPEGLVPVEGARIAVRISSGWRYAMTDANGHYEVRGLFAGAKSVNVTKEGYLASEAVAAISGDTTLDVIVVRR